MRHRFNRRRTPPALLALTRVNGGILLAINAVLISGEAAKGNPTLPALRTEYRTAFQQERDSYKKLNLCFHLFMQMPEVSFQGSQNSKFSRKKNNLRPEPV